MEVGERDGLDPGKRGGTLVVVLHGLRGGPARMAGVTATVRESWPDATIFCPRLPYAFTLSRACPELVAATVVEKIDGLMQQGDHDRIVLVGHSIGSLIARKVAILAHGEQENDGQKRAPFEPGIEGYAAGRSWAGRIDRLVMLAGMARGWSLTSARNPLVAAWWNFWSIVFDICLNGGLTLLRVRQGAPFIVQTRLQWLALVQALRQRRDKPIQVVQLLGSQDDTVAPDDTIDFAVDVSSETFVMIELPYTDHAQAIVMDDGANRDRKWRFMAALSKTPAELRALRDQHDDPIAIPNIFAVNGAPPDSDTKVTDVVFVIHGIRDRGFWTRKIARKVMEQVEAAPGDRKARAMTLSYGYLAMAPFVLPWVRRAKVRWMMDSYAEWRALYPRADFHYVGHSNGTYLAARALADYPAARFRRIVFAGSVVRRQYDWERVIKGKWRQVDAVMNYVASKDWVVAIFPNGLSRIRAFDLGSAGHNGFDQLASSAAVPKSGARVSPVLIGPATSYQVDYVAGGHGAGIRESQWDDIARFIADGRPPQRVDMDFVPRQVRWARALGWMPPLSLALVLAPVLGLGLGLFLLAVSWASVAGWVVFALYLLAIHIVITRV